jgi:hypothetical protein
VYFTIWSYCWRIMSQSIVLVESTRPRFGQLSSSPAAGRYSFTASTPAADALRPLRDPDASELDEDDGGASEAHEGAERLAAAAITYTGRVWTPIPPETIRLSPVM